MEEYKGCLTFDYLSYSLTFEKLSDGFSFFVGGGSLNRFLLSFLLFVLSLQSHGETLIPLSIHAVTTHRAKDVLVRVIQYNSDKAELRLESIRPIHHELLDFVDIKSFTVNGRTYEFAKCDALAVNSVQVESESVQVEFECFVPKAVAVVAACALPIDGLKFGKMTCERKER
jgi:hypothetical protein